MDIGAFTVARGDLPFAAAVDWFAAIGVRAVEIGTGAYAPAVHANLAALADSAGAREDFLGALDERGLRLAALSCHGNPLHPRPEIAAAHRDVWRRTVAVAAALGVRDVVTFAGLPAADPVGRTPVWITYPWPEEHAAALAWQWEEVALPYWREEAARCADHDVHACIEPHPNFLVFSPATLARLRDGVGRHGDRVAANVDPSHFFWQGIDPAVAVRELHEAGVAIRHVHAKDAAVDPAEAGRVGVLDTRVHEPGAARAWRFRTVGDGHDADTWGAFLAALRAAGYDGALSIEHEDLAEPASCGIPRAVSFLRGLLGAA